MFDVVQNQGEKRNRNLKPRKNNFSFHISFNVKKVLIWGGVILLAIFLIGYYLYKNYYSNYNYIKEDSSQYLVYTLDTSTNNQNMHNEVPYINIDSEDARLVNQTIQQYAESFLKNKNNLMVYDSQLNGEVLSILLRMSDYSSGYSFPDVSFHTYNFDLNDQTLMTDEELLSLFDVTEDEVKQKIESQFQKYYQQEVKKGFFASQECNYDCFLNWRGIQNYNYMDSVYYYVENGRLVAYRPFTIYSVYGEEEFFDDESYAFSITK